MDVTKKIITKLPLVELWRADGFTSASRVRWLTAENIVELLQFGRVQFVVADVGVLPHWISLVNCFDFWKREVQPHLAAPDSKVSLDSFPDDYCYFASEWSGESKNVPIVVCEKHH
jgi:hypothetical protein